MSTSSSSDEPTPLLLAPSRRSLRRHSLQEAARFLRRASSRRMMREPSMLVREAAAEQLEDRQTDWAYSTPVVFVDVVWNLAFVAAAAAVLAVGGGGTTGAATLRVWIVGYAVQCGVHVGCVVVEYSRRQRRRQRVAGSEEEGYVTLAELNDDTNSGVAKHLESVNTMLSLIWWIIGFYWVSIGGSALAMEAPQLYWLSIIFLAFDVFFIFFCVAVACVIGIAVCCCLPCIIAILYAVTDQEGIPRENIEQLPKYKFRRSSEIDQLSGEIQGTIAGVMTECGTDTPIEHSILFEDAECCICLTTYGDGVELRELPCGHHFHCTCVDKWLYINATCPLCKYNIAKTSNSGSEGV